jgi:hypothetical protein
MITKKGSFLIEALLAAVILNCALTVIIRSYMAALTAAGVQEKYTEAIILLQEELDGLMSKGFIDHDRDWTYSKSVAEDIFEIRIVTKSLAGRHVDQVRIDVSWPAGASRQRSVSAATYLMDAETKDQAYAQY